MKDTFYFSHDYNARTDPKIKRLLARHGMLGYGIYWAIIEDLYNNANALQTDCECIAYDLRVEYELIRSVIFDFDLFKIDGEFFSSLSIQRRLDDRNEKSEKARKSAEYRWNNKTENANAMRTHSEGNAKKERKGKERKLNEIKKIQYGDCVFLNDDEFLKLKNTYGEVAAKGMIEILDNYKASSGKNYKNDYRAILNWVVDRWNEKQKNRKTNGHDFAVTDTRFVPKEYDENEKF